MTAAMQVHLPNPSVGAPDPFAVDRLLPYRPATTWSDHIARLGPLPATTATGLSRNLDEGRLLGRGGAGFPTARKIAAVGAAAAAARTSAVVVVNCCEGDPTSNKDEVLISRSPHLVVDGAVAAAIAASAARVVFAAHQQSTTAQVLRRALADRPPLGIDLEVVEVPPRYVASEATALVRLLNSADARPAGKLLPIWEKGVEGRPTLVDNAETLAQLALLSRFGPTWFAGVGVPHEPGTSLVTIGGAVPHPGVVEVPNGAPVGAVLARAGALPAGWALFGGVAGSWADLSRTTGIGYSTAELRAAGVTRGIASITVLPPDSCLLVETARILQFLADAGARQCGPCMFGLPAIAEDLSGLIDGDRSALDRLRRRLPVINGRGACSHPDGAVALATSALSAVSTQQPRHWQRHLNGHRCRPSAVIPLGGQDAMPMTPGIGGRP